MFGLVGIVLISTLLNLDSIEALMMKLESSQKNSLTAHDKPILIPVIWPYGLLLDYL